jgi:hypothetical protein
MVDPKLAPQYYQKNAITYQAHRRQVIWQIYAPIAGVILLVLLAAILIVLSPKFDTERWANISLILLISTAIFSAIVFNVLIIISIFGTRRTLQVLPYYLFVGQSYTFRIRSRLRILSDRAVEPVLWTKSNFARLQVFQPRRSRTNPGEKPN